MRQYYVLSQDADKDLEDIFDYTEAQFGIDPAIEYLSILEITFEHLCDHPRSGRKRDNIKTGLHSFSKNSHVIFYKTSKDHIVIVRVLHASRDVIKFLPPQ